MSIYDEVLAFILAPDPARFEPLALRVFRYQFDHVPPYREYCLSRGLDAGKVRSLGQVPSVSTVAFKYARMESREGSPSSAARLFLTSGTTVGMNERGRHRVLRPEIYHASAMSHLRRMLFPDGWRTPILALHPVAERMPESSLSRMISWGIEEFGTGAVLCAATRASVDTQAAIGFLRERERCGDAVSIFGTTASLAALFEAMRLAGVAIKLPPGSRVMDTGGAKGQAVPLNPAQLVAETGRMLGVAPALVINEYGMTELCSQLYDATRFNSAANARADEFDRAGAAPAPRMKIAPPWLKPFAIDPVTLAPLADGEVGLLSFFDLANVASVSAIMTEDFGAVRDGAAAIFGRAAAGDPRGCALAIQEFVRCERQHAGTQALQ